LAMTVGPEKVEALMKRSGIPENTEDLAAQSGRITLGIAPVSPVDMADAYATIAAGGKQADWFTVRQVTAPSGEVLHEVVPAAEQVFGADVAADVTYAMQQVIEGSNGTGRVEASKLERPAAGKTGTHEDKSAWFAGFTPQLAASVAMFRTDYAVQPPTMLSMNGEAGFEPFTGGRYPARIWTAFMKAALEGQEVVEFPERADVGEDVNPSPTPTPTPTPPTVCPPGQEGTPPKCKPIGTEPTEVAVPNVVGLSQQQAENRLRQDGFNVAVQERDTDQAQSGQVIEQNPSGGTAPTGSTVTIVVAVAPEPDPEPEMVPIPPIAPGSDPGAAQAALRGAGFDVAIREEPSREVTKGAVIRTEPSDEAPAGSTVTIVVSKGPGP
jgi:membrane peptidoglycan carboxypeptidase